MIAASLCSFFLSQNRSLNLMASSSNENQFFSESVERKEKESFKVDDYSKFCVHFLSQNHSLNLMALSSNENQIFSKSVKGRRKKSSR